MKAVADHPSLQRLVNALNSIDGINVSCSTTEKTTVRSRPIGIWFYTENWQSLAWVGYYARACHSGVTWTVAASVDCAASTNTFHLCSVTTWGTFSYGEEALKEAELIAKAIEQHKGGWDVID